MPSFNAEETLTRFVLRARRVQSHSLAQDWDSLVSYAQGKWNANLNQTGNAQITIRLPVDEESFESLAARIRPLTLNNEPIYYSNVFRAIRQLLGDEAKQGGIGHTFSALNDRWKKATSTGNRIHAYGVQVGSKDGSLKTNVISDIALAKAWMYQDLVHANLTGGEMDALKVPLEERYTAAVHIYSYIAVLTVRTLEFVEFLCSTEKIFLPALAWEEEVIIGKSEIVDEANVYSAPVDAEFPDISKPLSESEGWTPLTASAAASLDPTNHVTVNLVGGSGQTVALKSASIVGRFPEGEDGEKVIWHIIVGGGALVKVSFMVHGDNLAPNSIKMEPILESNVTRLAWCEFALEFTQVARLDFEYSDSKIASLPIPNLDPNTVAEFDREAGIYSDLVLIEKKSQSSIACPNGEISLEQSIVLRQASLLWQGKVFRINDSPQWVAKDSDPLLEDLISPATNYPIFGLEIPVPKMRVWHPRAYFVDHGERPDLGPDVRIYEATIPDGEKFLAWAPDLIEVDTSVEVLPTADWDLLDFIEKW